MALSDIHTNLFWAVKVLIPNCSSSKEETVRSCKAYGNAMLTILRLHWICAQSSWDHAGKMLNRQHIHCSPDPGGSLANTREQVTATILLFMGEPGVHAASRVPSSTVHLKTHKWRCRKSAVGHNRLETLISKSPFLTQEAEAIFSCC